MSRVSRVMVKVRVGFKLNNDAVDRVFREVIISKLTHASPLGGNVPPLPIISRNRKLSSVEKLSCNKIRSVYTHGRLCACVPICLYTRPAVYTR